MPESREMSRARREWEWERTFDAIPDLITILDREHRILRVNKAMADALGTTPKELIGRTCYEIVHGTQTPPAFCPHARLITRGIVSTAEAHEDRLGGDFLISVSPLYDRDGDLFGSVHVARDITERKRVEKALEEKTHELGERVQELNCLYGISALRDQEGMAFDRLLQEIAELIPAGWEYPEIACCRILLEGKAYESKSFEETPWKQMGEIKAFRKPMGRVEVYYKEQRPEVDEGPFLKEERKLIDAVAERLGRIVERQWTEDAVRGSEEKHRTLFETMAQGVVYQAGSGEIISANPAAERILGLSLDQLQGRTSMDPRWKAIHEDGSDFPGETHPSMVALKTGKKVENVVMGVFSPIHEDYRWIRINAVPQFRDGEDKPYQVYTTFDDITEIKLAREELQNAHDELEKRVAERTAEVQLMSSRLLKAQEEERRLIALELHDGIGQVLGAIKFRVETALQQVGENGPSPERSSLEPIIRMLQEAVEDVRRIQRNLRPSVLDDLGILATMSWFCREFMTTYDRISVEKQIDIQEADVPDSMKIVIFRILQEALNNIAKHSKASLVKLSFRKVSGNIEFMVQDNGQGFDLPSTLSNTRSERGLGLDGMRERAILSGGNFLIESQPGSGTSIKAIWKLEEVPAS
jgi:PAS domain S-box-containing protein